jgi:protein SCO1
MFRALTLSLLLAAAVAPRVHAHDAVDAPHAAAGAEAPPDAATADASPKQKAARLFFSDRRLVTQRGDEVAFYSDVLRDKVVLINFIFTRCTDSCPTQSARLAAVQPLLAGSLGRGISLVSISVDPEHDTPQALREYATRFGARDGWLFLTGSKRNVEDVVRRLGQLTPSAESHTTLFILGNVKSGHWIKMDPDSAPAEIARHLRRLAAET